MGGTSTDVSLAYEGQSRVTKDWYIEFGYPIRFASIEVLTIGAGGGSLAWTDEAGSLRNGPQSAGAYPGPACYGNGNPQPTNTDANVMLGRLGTSLAGGKMTLDPALARRGGRGRRRKAVRPRPARGRGRHPEGRQRQHVGCGPADLDQPRLRSARLRAGRLRRRRRAARGRRRHASSSIPVVIVPPNPGVTSALGCLLVDVQHDFSAELHGRRRRGRSRRDRGAVRRAGEGSARASRPRGRRATGHRPAALDRHDVSAANGARSPSTRRARSARSPTSSRASMPSTSANTISAATARPVSFFRLNLKAVGVVPKAEFAVHEPTGSDRRAGRPAHGLVRRQSRLDTPVYERDRPALRLRLSRPRDRRAGRFDHRRVRRAPAPRSTSISTSSFA